MRAAALLLAAWALCGVTACTGLPRQSVSVPNYQPENFDGSAHARHFDASPARTCEAARRALLSQGYAVNTAQADQVSGRKYFQPGTEHHVQIEFRVVCAAEADGHRATVAFVNGLKEQYVVRKSKDSASLGVGAIGSLSLPLEGGLDSMVKVASETLTDAALYERFFQLVREFLDKAPALDEAPPPATAAPAALPAPAATPAPAASAPARF